MKTVWRFIDWTCMIITVVCSCILAFVSDSKIAWICCVLWCIRSMIEHWQLEHIKS